MTVFAVANTALINMLMASRLIYGMATQGVLPRGLGKVLPDRRSPWAAIVFTTVLALGADLRGPAAGRELGGGGAGRHDCAAAAGGLRRGQHLRAWCCAATPAQAGHFRAPTVMPVLGAVACLYLLGPWARLEADMIQYKIAGGLLALGVVLWVITFVVNQAPRARRPPSRTSTTSPTDTPVRPPP